MSKMCSTSEDTIAQGASIAKAADVIESWLEQNDHRAALVALILTYGDDAAEELLSALREDFWAGMS